MYIFVMIEKKKKRLLDIFVLEKSIPTIQCLFDFFLLCKLYSVDNGGY